jgi:hypothetical protein
LEILSYYFQLLELNIQWIQKLEKKGSTYNIWKIESHWGRREQSDHYLIAMTKIKDAI